MMNFTFLYLYAMVIIVGAGLSGLLTAFRLNGLNIPYVIVEARDRVGGRISTIYGENEAPLEMGATWFGLKHVNLVTLLDELGIGYYKQYLEGRSFFQTTASVPATPITLPQDEPSYRIEGGTASLINRLVEAIDAAQILLEHPVRSIEVMDSGVRVQVGEKTIEGDLVAVCLPPRLSIGRISFKPDLPEAFVDIALNTQTWMGKAIKVAMTYANPFWRFQKQSGAIFCNTGPITEFYDHSNREGNAFALCGFVHPSLHAMASEDRRAIVTRHLREVLGPEVDNMQSYYETVWATEEHTSSANEMPLLPHQHNGDPRLRDCYLNNKVLFSGSESAAQFPGYMEGAVVSAYEAVRQINERWQKTTFVSR